ncbi:MAG: hypothetical protein EXS32_04330 [Opitutus sp.]|nr:hypothetical protein [Opitutus sp.]
MDLPHLTADIAGRADDFLAGTTDRAQARAGIAELIELDYFHLSPNERAVVINGVMIALETGEFFGTEFVGDPFAEEPAKEDDE